jgi:hypothetical protein
MKEDFVQLGTRERQVADLLLQGCDNAEIAEQLKMPRRTVKAHFQRMFVRFGITSGIKRVKLATLLYRLDEKATGRGKKSSHALLSSRKVPRSAKQWDPSGPERTSLRTTPPSSTANVR